MPVVPVGKITILHTVTKVASHAVIGSISQIGAGMTARFGGSMLTNGFDIQKSTKAVFDLQGILMDGAIGGVFGGVQGLKKPQAFTSSQVQQVNGVGESGDYKSISELLKETKCSSDELYDYLSKNVSSDVAETFAKTGSWPEGIQIPKNSTVLNPDGSINWTKAAEGGYILDANGRAIKENFIPQIGEVIDRYGSPNGRYTSPVVNGKSYAYAERSLPYVENSSNYHQYEVIGDFSKIEEYVKNCTDTQLKNEIDALVTAYYDSDYSKIISYKGKVAKVEGWGIGGATQYEFSLPVEQLEKLGILKEIK